MAYRNYQNNQNGDSWEIVAGNNLVLFGKVGNGKSAVGNSIIGKNVFVSRVSDSAVTTTCKLETTTLYDQVVNVIDTPGIFHSSTAADQLADEFVNCATLAKDGIDGFILVCSIRTRFSAEEEGVIRCLRNTLGDKVIDYLIVVFTGGDELKTSHTTLDEYLSKCPPSFQRVYELCNKRVVLFDNKTKDETQLSNQVQRLMSLVKVIDFENDGKSYKPDIIQKMKRARPSWNQVATSMMKGAPTQSKQVAQQQPSHRGGDVEQLRKQLDEAKEELEKVKHENEALKNLRENQRARPSWNQIKTSILHGAPTQSKQVAQQQPSHCGGEVEQLRKQLEEAKEELEKFRHENQENRRMADTNLVLFGRVGNGKSSLGNSIIRKTEINDANEVVSVRAFESKISASGVTMECQMETTTLDDGRVVNVIDTPGIFDSAVSVEKLRQEIVKCMHLTKDGIHGFLLVFSIRSRFSEEEKCAIKYLKDFFGDQIVNYMIIVFTGADELKDWGMTLQNYLTDSCPQPLKDVMSMCNDRVVTFDNKTQDENVRQEQVQQLLSSVQMVIDNNDGKPFTNDYFEELKKARLMAHGEQNNLNMHMLYENQINKINESIARRLDEVIEKFTAELARERGGRQELENANKKLQQDLNDKKPWICSIL